jgi:hypothetical protein
MTERICHHIVARDLVIGAEAVIRRCDAREVGPLLDLLGRVRGDGATHRGNTGRHERKPRRKSTKALIETAKRAGLAVTALKPDGSVEIGKPEIEPVEHINGNPWDEVLRHEDH